MSNGMNIVTVIPLAQGVYKEDLSYFTARDIAPGTIVSVPLRKKIVDALVTSVRHLADTKSEIKTSAFTLRKIETIKGPMPFYTEFWRAAQDAKTYFLSTSGATLYSLIPDLFLDKHASLPTPSPRIEKIGSKIAQEKLAFQMPLADRLGFYKTYIREAFAKKQSVFFCLPTVREAETFYGGLQRGIESHAFLFHGDISDKIQLTRYRDAVTDEHPIVIVATGSYLFIPRSDIATIIVERESSSAYKQLPRPHVDIRAFAEFLSYRLGTKLIFADTFLRAETIHRVHEGELSEIGHLSFHLSREIKREIIDMRTDVAGVEKKKWTMITPALQAKITETLAAGKNVFLFSLRKGYAPVTICGHCDTTLGCSSCDAPLVLYETKTGKRMYVCNRCGNKETAERACGNCQSWKLVPLGVGSEGVAKEIAKLFPDTHIELLDKEHAKTRRQAEKIAEVFSEAKGSILVGTEMALPYIASPVGLAAIVSFDSLFAIPSFRAAEKIISLVAALENVTESSLIIQTKNTADQTIKDIAAGNLAGLYAREIADRERFGYPPFTTLARVTYQDTHIDPEKIRSIVEAAWQHAEPLLFPSPVYKFRTSCIMKVGLKIPKDKWSPARILHRNEDISYIESQASMLGPAFDTVVDPEDIA